MKPCCPGEAEHLPAHGKWLMNSSFCFAFALPIKRSLSQPNSLSPFYPSNSLPNPVLGEWVSSCIGLICSWGQSTTQHQGVWMWNAIIAGGWHHTYHQSDFQCWRFLSTSLKLDLPQILTLSKECWPKSTIWPGNMMAEIEDLGKKWPHGMLWWCPYFKLCHFSSQFRDTVSKSPAWTMSKEIKNSARAVICCLQLKRNRTSEEIQDQRTW